MTPCLLLLLCCCRWVDEDEPGMGNGGWEEVRGDNVIVAFSKKDPKAAKVMSTGNIKPKDGGKKGGKGAAAGKGKGAEPAKPKPKFLGKARERAGERA